MEGAHEKGGIEESIGFSRRNWMVPVPKFESIDELNAYVLEKCTEDEKRTVDGQKQPIGEAFAEEKALLLPLPGREFDPGVKRGVIVDRYQTVGLAENHYSAPASMWARRFGLSLTGDT